MGCILESRSDPGTDGPMDLQGFLRPECKRKGGTGDQKAKKETRKQKICGDFLKIQDVLHTGVEDL